MFSKKGRREIMLSDNISGLSIIADLFMTLCDSTVVEIL